MGYLTVAIRSYGSFGGNWNGRSVPTAGVASLREPFRNVTNPSSLMRAMHFGLNLTPFPNSKMNKNTKGKHHAAYLTDIRQVVF